MLDDHLDVYQCYNNLIGVNSALTIETKKGERNIERTPCMAEEITDHMELERNVMVQDRSAKLGQYRYL
jgi:hypothetical protein